jgi:hypothetical protein
VTKCEHWGNPCERHKNVAAWVAQVKIDEDGLHCFGCFIESRERQARCAAFKRAIEVAMQLDWEQGKRFAQAIRAEAEKP